MSYRNEKLGNCEGEGEGLSYECDYLLGEMLIEYSPPLWVFSLGLQMRMEIGDWRCGCEQLPTAGGLSCPFRMNVLYFSECIVGSFNRGKRELKMLCRERSHL